MPSKEVSLVKRVGQTEGRGADRLIASHRPREARRIAESCACSIALRTCSLSLHGHLDTIDVSGHRPRATNDHFLFTNQHLLRHRPGGADLPGRAAFDENSNNGEGSFGSGTATSGVRLGRWKVVELGVRGRTRTNKRVVVFELHGIVGCEPSRLSWRQRQHYQYFALFMDPISVLGQLAVVIYRSSNKYAAVGKLPTVVDEFLNYLKTVEVLLNSIQEREAKREGSAHIRINDAVVSAVDNLSLSVVKGFAVLEECTEVVQIRGPGGMRKTERRLKWIARLFNENTERTLKEAKKDIGDAMNILLVERVFGNQDEIWRLIGRIDGLSNEITEALKELFDELHIDSEHQEKDPLQMIGACVSIEDFVRFYDSEVFQDSLKRLLKSQGSNNPEVRAKEWAIRLRTESEADEALNKDRKLCLSLLYKLCDRWKDNSNTSVTDHSIVKDFKKRRILNILSCCLVLDRAQCLYKMKYPGSAAFGMHWVAEHHVEGSSFWKARLYEVEGEPTMNKRLLWLLELSKLGLQNIPTIVWWLQPQRCDRLEAPSPIAQEQRKPDPLVPERQKPDPD